MDPMTKIISLAGDEAAEHIRVYQEHAAARAHASAVLGAKGLGSAEFVEANAAADKLWARLQDIRLSAS